ncbi:MAG TPA: cyclodeaminase/cyclohydrolase family protein [Candidatus Omnitrophota bacterium]|nr:cyclodeaminase/cyclohydrolase family protein [Candidatus Omnitrophota bacterium]HRY86108.1 cyclodeaminase/cyclohydrolase family protein [Candidatus Omnitrophota bacterium]
MKKYTDLSLETYLEKLASDAPVPGGGSVSAYVGALGMGLTQMVARIALKRKPKKDLTSEQKFQDEANRKRMQEIIDSLEKTKADALQVVSLDPKVYDEVMACYQEGASAEKLEDALQNAFRLQADLALMLVMAKEWNAHMKTLVKGAVANDLIVSDNLLSAAFEGAYHTAHINVVYMKKQERKERAEKALAELRGRLTKGS